MAAINWFRFASPASFYPLAGKLTGLFGWVAVLLAIAGLYVGFVIAPTDAQQGESYRIIFIHVPAAWMAMFIYVVIAFWSVFSLALNARLPAMMAQALAPTGALFAFIALWTGAFWGRPTWGTYWVWDARLTSTLVLLFLYLGLIALRSGIDDPRRADRACALLALVGVVNVPIIYFSVRWWNTLHQPASVSRLDAPAIHPAMLTPLLVMALAFMAYFATVLLWRIEAALAERRVAARRMLAEAGPSSPSLRR